MFVVVQLLYLVASQYSYVVKLLRALTRWVVKCSYAYITQSSLVHAVPVTTGVKIILAKVARC